MYNKLTKAGKEAEYLELKRDDYVLNPDEGDALRLKTIETFLQKHLK